MLAVSPNSVARSSLEAMLESLRQRDGNDKPKDMPPALPARPKLTARARLPSTKRPLPTSLEVGELETSSSSCNVKKDESKELRENRFEFKKVKEFGESPYFVEPLGEEEHQQQLTSEEKYNVKLGYFIEKKLRVWCQRHNFLWESGQIQSTFGEKATVMLSDGSVVTVPTQELLPTNPDILEGVDDLIQLSYLNNPSVLHNLEKKYSQEVVYTKAGPILIAVNPFKDVKLYGNEFVTAYRQKILDSPHIYAVADKAYNEMMTEEINQSIIVSGESGAGKTETAKNAMEYLVALGGCSGIESKVLQTGCLLEAFGNAKTSLNDNSSRFGKLMDIYFNASGVICGAKIQTLFLEKSRVVQLCQGERSYHIFYQLCAGAPSDLRGKLWLKNACDYNYLNQSDCLEIHGVNDAQKFSVLMGALDTLNICKEDQEHAFEMLAAVLWLGNISYLVIDNENHIEVVANEAVGNAASLIGCGFQDLIIALSTHRIQAEKDEITKMLTLQEAIDSRDALAKYIYESLFGWLVEKINLSLAIGIQQTARSISILDISGFESLKKNSFEQFWINYANERLQQHFNRHIFKLEQEDCEFNGIDWTKVDFEDNQDCLDLFEKKPNGLISLLDEESNLLKSSDITFATKLKQQLTANHCFKADKSTAFSVCHYAGEVLYDTGGFLEKNRDPLHHETIQLLLSCTSSLPHLFASKLLKQSPRPADSLAHPGMPACQKQRAATKFKGQLFKLIQQLEKTRPHFIRCIKPNNKHIPGAFEKDLVLQQLRYYGILEVIRISRSGYPTRMTHQDFTRRYGFLLPENKACQDPLSTSVAILKQFDILPEMYQVGFTKLFLRAGQINALEDVRKQVQHGTREVPKCSRGYCASRHFHEFKGGVVTLQSYIRGEMARKEYGGFVRLQKQGFLIDKQMMAVVQIQSVIRGWLVRRHYVRPHSPIEQSNGSKKKPGRRISEVKDLSPEILPSVVEELQNQIMMGEVALGQKEIENAALREQVQQSEARRSEYEAKMKSMEEMWQKQMASLQMSLAAAKKSLGTDKTTGQPRKLHGAQSPQYDSDDISMGPHTPGGNTPIRFSNNGIDTVAAQETNGTLNAVGPLMKEFEQRKENFDSEALAIVEVKPGVNPIQELIKLKRSFETWKKDYKARLREAKGKVHRLGHPEAEKHHRRKWWGKKSTKN